MSLKRIFPNHPNPLTDPKILGAGLTFLSNIIRTRMFNTNAKRGPLFLSWLTTFKCNANCLTCSTHELSRLYPDTISLEQAKEIAHQIGRAKTWVVGFSGGEPLLWPHLFEVIKILKSYGITVYIITNGLILKDKVAAILDAKVDTVVVSIDSLNPEEHDQNRGRPGLFRAMMEGVELLKSKRSGKVPIIKSTIVLSKKNYPKIGQIVAKLNQIVDLISIQPIVTGCVTGLHNIKEQVKSEFLPSSVDEAQVSEKIQKLAKLYPQLNSHYFKSIPIYWFHPERLLKVKCWSPFLRLEIMPNGKVLHCLANPRYSTVGNLNNMTLMEVWNSPEMKRHREEIRRHKNNCICWCQDTSFNAFLDTLPLINKIPIFNKHKNKSIK